MEFFVRFREESTFPYFIIHNTPLWEIRQRKKYLPEARQVLSESVFD